MQSKKNIFISQTPKTAKDLNFNNLYETTEEKFYPNTKQEVLIRDIKKVIKINEYKDGGTILTST